MRRHSDDLSSWCDVTLKTVSIQDPRGSVAARSSQRAAAELSLQLRVAWAIAWVSDSHCVTSNTDRTRAVSQRCGVLAFAVMRRVVTLDALRGGSELRELRSKDQTILLQLQMRSQ